MTESSPTSGSSEVGRLPAPPSEQPAPDAGPPLTVAAARTPRVGDVTPGWRVVIAVTWLGVIVALAAVWNASVQLGLSTWWLGPRGQSQPLPIRLSPFVAPVLMLLSTINLARWLGWLGLVASGAIVAVGIGDLRRVGSIATLEILIGVAAAAISIASFTGTYRRRPTDETTAGSRAA